MEDKNSFASRLPFAQRKIYLWWIKATLLLMFFLILILSSISVKDYLIYQDLLIQKNSLLGSVSQLDEIVSKKNKLSSQDHKKDQYRDKNHGIYTKIAGFLTDIESILALGVNLDSFEFSSNKIEITGYSDSIEGLSETIYNLQKLSFVKDHDIEQVTKDIKFANHKLAFTIIINL